MRTGGQAIRKARGSSEGEWVQKGRICVWMNMCIWMGIVCIVVLCCVVSVLCRFSSLLSFLTYLAAAAAGELTLKAARADDGV